MRLSLMQYLALPHFSCEACAAGGTRQVGLVVLHPGILELNLLMYIY
jgi:hypothetical protein